MKVQSSQFRVDSSSFPVPVLASVPRSNSSRALRSIRIGLLGFGQVGQAVARLADDGEESERLGLRFVVDQALVQNLSRPRHGSRPPRLTADPSAFLNGRYDVVIEALSSVEPARAIVSHLLWRGTSVVTANKALVATHGAELRAIAAESGAAFRYEACALSAVPFLGALAARPLVASVDRVTAIVNGTCNFLLTRLAEPGSTFTSALEEAQRAGYAEPDPSRDLDGCDAADKLTLLASLFGWGSLSRDRLEVRGIRALTADDLAAAREIGGAIKPVVWAARGSSGIEAFVGPAFLSSSEPLAALGGALNGIRLDGKYVSNLFFSGPGAGPDVTGATLLDDAVEAALAPRRTRVSTALDTFQRPESASQGLSRESQVSAPITRWFVRVTFPGVAPPNDALRNVIGASGLTIEQVASTSIGSSRWVAVGSHSREDVEASCIRLRTVHRIESTTFRRI